jgi:hypothetical protein
MDVFQIALIDKVPSGQASYFDYSAKNIITYTLWEHLVSIAMARPGGFIPGPSWSLSAAHLQAHDVAVYFVLDPSSSVARRTGVSKKPGPNDGGLTAQTSGGVVCEVYVEGSMPARRLANIAFHEIMHAKLDVGARVIGNLHTQGGGGLATPPTNEWTPLTAGNIKLMSKHLFRKVRPYTGGMGA